MHRPNSEHDAKPVWFLLALLILFSVVLVVQLVVVMGAHADGLSECRSIKAVTVPPQAVVHQPDGDTFHIFTFDVPNVVKIRVLDAETPEKNQEGFQEAKDFTQEWLARGPFKVVTCGTPTLDRIVGRVERDGKTLAEELKEAGFWRWQH